MSLFDNPFVVVPYKRKQEVQNEKTPNSQPKEIVPPNEDYLNLVYMPEHIPPLIIGSAFSTRPNASDNTMEMDILSNNELVCNMKMSLRTGHAVIIKLKLTD